MKIYPVLLGLILVLSQSLNAQGQREKAVMVLSKKRATAIRISSPIKIDGVLDEAEWSSAPGHSRFTMEEPNPGSSPSQKTEVKILYDDKAIYFGVLLHDDDPSQILTELSERDDVGNTDWFYIGLDPYLNGTNGFGFLIAATGVQFDAILGENGEDTNWDAVWTSKTSITEQGWIVEVKLPFSAIRFPSKTIQQWGINFGRKIQRHQEKVWWSPIRPKISGFVNQFGVLDGIRQINAPIRLSATPFVAQTTKLIYDEHEDDHGVQTQLNGGLDIKYGINDAFTLDMTLIPDFGQVRSDEQVLNLSPFEVFFNENRPFFTEGLELFSKGDLFYSRRVGGSPFYRYSISDQLNEDEKILSNPQTSRLINATKVSGRSNSGLGIGLFNAVERREFAEIIDTNTNQIRHVNTNPLSNYNVIVLDQNLANNSSVSLINTHVFREGEATDAFVTGSLLSLRNKKNSYAVGGGYARSQRVLVGVDQVGHVAQFELSKISGTYRWGLEYVEESDQFNPNDLGFLRSPNERSGRLRLSKLSFKPKGIFNNYRLRFNLNYERLYKPDIFVKYNFNFSFNYQLKNFWRGGSWIRFSPNGTKDYFEPRTGDFSMFYHKPKNIRGGGWFNTDQRKKISINGWFGFQVYDDPGFYNFNYGLFPNFRVNDRFAFSIGVELDNNHGNYGWVQTVEDNIYFGKRDQKSIVSFVAAKYSFNHNMSLNLNQQYNWTQVHYVDFYTLNEVGWFNESDFDGNFDQTFNFFNVDLVYRWRFLPGSDFFITYKSNILDFQDHSDISYGENLRTLFSKSQVNTFSLKIIYYLDYLDLKKS